MEANTPHVWANNCTTAAAPSIDELVKLCRDAKAESDRVNAGMIDALRGYIAASGESVFVWAERLRVNAETFMSVLAGKRQPDWYFWEQVRRVFGPMRDADPPA